MNTQYKFKSSFAGFRRTDVIYYIEKLSNDFFEYRKESERTVRELNEKIALLEQQIIELGGEEGEAAVCDDSKSNVLGAKLGSFFDKYNKLKSGELDSEEPEQHEENEDDYDYDYDEGDPETEIEEPLMPREDEMQSVDTAHDLTEDEKGFLNFFGDGDSFDDDDESASESRRERREERRKEKKEKKEKKIRNKDKERNRDEVRTEYEPEGANLLGDDSDGEFSLEFDDVSFADFIGDDISDDTEYQNEEKTEEIGFLHSDDIEDEVESEANDNESGFSDLFLPDEAEQTDTDNGMISGFDVGFDLDGTIQPYNEIEVTDTADSDIGKAFDNEQANADKKAEKKDELLDNFDVQFIEQLQKILSDY